MKKFIKPISIFFVVLAVLGAGVLIGGFALGKSSKAKPEVLKIATKSAGKELATDIGKTPEQTKLPNQNLQKNYTNNGETYNQTGQTTSNEPKTSNNTEKSPENTTPLLTPKTPPLVDDVSFQALKKKQNYQDIARNQINIFWNVAGPNYYPTVFLDNAQGYINQSIALNSSISTTYPEALICFNLLKNADNYTSQAISHYKENVRLRIIAFTYNQFSAEYLQYKKLADDEFNLGFEAQANALNDNTAAFYKLEEIRQLLI